MFRSDHLLFEKHDEFQCRISNFNESLFRRGWNKLGTRPIAKILSAKNARAWVSMVSYLKK